MKEQIKKAFPHLYDSWVKRKEKQYRDRLKKAPIEEQLKELKSIYKNCIGRELNIDDPKSYTEKIQWSKLYDRDPIKTLLADKYLVKDWAADRIGREHVVPLLGVWDRFDDIDFDKLPDQFVLKTNHYSGTNIVVTDKKTIDKKELRKKFNYWMKLSVAYNSFELQYENITPKIIAETYIPNLHNEYQFFCFDGEPAYFWRLNNQIHSKDIYDMDYKPLDWNTASMLPRDPDYKIPEYIDEIVAMAKKLSAGLQQVRCDLYDVDGQIYLGEMTFTSGSGLVAYVPDDIDFWLGSKWNLRKNTKQ